MKKEKVWYCSVAARQKEIAGGNMFFSSLRNRISNSSKFGKKCQGWGERALTAFGYSLVYTITPHCTIISFIALHCIERMRCSSMGHVTGLVIKGHGHYRAWSPKALPSLWWLVPSLLLPIELLYLLIVSHWTVLGTTQLFLSDQ